MLIDIGQCEVDVLDCFDLVLDSSLLIRVSRWSTNSSDFDISA